MKVININTFFFLHYDDNKYKVRTPASDESTMCLKEL